MRLQEGTRNPKAFESTPEAKASLAAAKGGWLALVVGVNVFLPACVAGFGRWGSKENQFYLLRV